MHLEAWLRPKLTHIPLTAPSGPLTGLREDFKEEEGDKEVGRGIQKERGEDENGHLRSFKVIFFGSVESHEGTIHVYYHTIIVVLSLKVTKIQRPKILKI